MASKKSSRRNPTDTSVGYTSSLGRKIKSTPHNTGGRAAIEKGRNFEDDVANLYRLQGAEIVQNIEVSQKKVDILATFSYPVKHRVIIECKDEKKAVDANQRVMQFKGLLDLARQTGEADSAEIITRVPWSDAAKGFAHKAGISLLTYTEKISKLIDFTNYLKELKSKYEDCDPARPSEPALGSYYVDLSAESSPNEKISEIPILNDYITRWLQQGDYRRQLAVFGDYGCGKSSMCLKLAHDLAEAYLKDPSSSRIPILLNLREFVGKIDIEAYITSFLDRECKAIAPKINLFKAMNNAGIFLLIFDGFDEMAVKADADTLESNLMEIEKLASPPKSKVLLTSRPEYFINLKEEKEALNPGLNPFISREAKYEPLRILPWTEKQVERFLERRVPLIKGASMSWTFYRDQIKTIEGLADMSRRPVLLDMIVKTLPTLITSNAVINLPNLYKTYLSEEIKRQKILKKRTLLLSEDQRLYLLRQIAVDFYTGKIPAITFGDASSLVEKYLRPPRHELEAYTREFLTNSFLIRKGDVYNFSHRSIMEYLVAVQFTSDIKENRSRAFGLISHQTVIFDFLKELEPDAETLLKWIKRTKDYPEGVAPYTSGNAATLLCKLSGSSLAGQDLSGTYLRRPQFDNADLRGTKFHEAIIKEGSFVNAKFFLKDLAPNIANKEYFRKKDTVSVTVDTSKFSFYFLKSHIGERVDIDDIYRFLGQHIEKEMKTGFPEGKILAVREPSDGEGRVMVDIIIEVRDFESIEKVRAELSRKLSTDIAVFHDEYKQLLKNKPARQKV